MANEQTEKKYELISGDWVEVIDILHHKHVLYRIRAIKDFDDVKAGDYGGYIESENNLSHEGSAWVYSDAVRIDKNAKLWGHALLCESAKMYHSAEVCDYAIVSGNTKIYEDAKIHGKATVTGNCYIHEISEICENSTIEGNHINIHGRTVIGGTSHIEGTDIEIYGETTMFGNTIISGTDIVILDTDISGAANIRDKAYICSNNDFISITNMGSERDVLTSYLTVDYVVMMSLLEFVGTYDEFLEYVRKNYEYTQFYTEFTSFAEVIKQRFTENRKYKLKGGAYGNINAIIKTTL